MQEEVYNEITKMKKETHDLQLSLQRYKGHDLLSANYEDLDELEQKLESSVNKVRARKVIFFFFVNFLLITFLFIFLFIPPSHIACSFQEVLTLIRSKTEVLPDCFFSPNQKI